MNSTDLSLSELFVVVLQSYLSLRPCIARTERNVRSTSCA